MELTRTQKLFYGFALAGCFLTVAAVDDSADQEEISEAHKTWAIEQARKAHHEKFYRIQPKAITEPAFAGKASK